MFRIAGLLIVITLAGCTHAGAGAPRPVPAPAAAPMPDSLVLAFTDTTDSLPARLLASGHYRRAPSDGGVTRFVALVPGEAPPLIVKPIAARDARDALDEGVDVLVTNDPAAVAYASTRADLVSLPLPWDRTYVLLAPGGAMPNATPFADSLLDVLRGELAANAVRAEARASLAPFWWSNADTCSAAPGDTRVARTPDAVVSRILHVQSDHVAGALAARLVALASDRGSPLAAIAPSLAASGGTVHADGVPLANFGRALFAGSGAAFVVALPAHTNDACRDRAALVRMAPWLGRGHVTPVALVDTRSRIIARRGVTGLPFIWLGASPEAARGTP